MKKVLDDTVLSLINREIIVKPEGETLSIPRKVTVEKSSIFGKEAKELTENELQNAVGRHIKVEVPTNLRYTSTRFGEKEFVFTVNAIARIISAKKKYYIFGYVYIELQVELGWGVASAE